MRLTFDAPETDADFNTEVSLNVANDDELLSLMRAANFTTIFIGIESPRRESLVETRKLQNLRGDILESVHKIRTRGRPHHIFMDLHIQVERDIDTTQSHFIVHDLQDRLRTAFPGLADIVIHTEPSDVGSGFSGESI